MSARVYPGALSLPAPLEASVVTLGTFDGVHLGHRELVRTAIAQAKARGVPSLAYTFDPHPASVLAPSKAPTLLLSLEDRVRYLIALGIDLVVVEPFSRDFSAIEAEHWVQKYLIEALQPQFLVVGFNFSYGYLRAGNPQTLRETGKISGFEVEVVSAFELDGQVVSSTRIRELVRTGDVETAAVFLGRPFDVRGMVIEGDQRGRTIGYPTANFRASDTLSPGFGVYAVRVTLSDQRGFMGVMNYGSRPTVDGSQNLFEVYLFDFSEDLYGHNIEVELVTKLRDEKKFEGLDALVTQIQNDVNAAREILG